MISENLTSEKIMKVLKESYADNNPKGLQISGFFEQSCYKQALLDVSTASFKHSEQRDTHSFFKANAPALRFFSSREFIEFASKISGKRFKKANCELRLFMNGCYTLLSDFDKPKTEFYFDMTPLWKAKWGGMTTYTADDAGRLAIPPSPNMLIISEGRSYVKYVNSLAKDEGRLVVYGTLA